MALNSITYTPSDVRVICLAEATFTPVYEYQDGKRTDTQRKTDDGYDLYAVRDAVVSIDGEQTQATIQAPVGATIPAGSIIAPSGSATARVRAQSVSASYATLAVTVYAQEWTVIGNIADALA